MKLLNLIGALSLLLLTCPSFSQETKTVIPEGLPTESVVPKLDSPQVVMNKALKFDSRFEASLGQDWMLDEPFLNNSSQVLEVVYGLSERYAIGVKATKYNSGLSDYSIQFREFSGLQFNRVPNPRSALGVLLYDRFMYGKWNFSQEKVLPTTVELVYELDIVDAKVKNLTMLAAGIGQKAYFSQRFGAGLFYKLAYHQWIDPNSVSLKPGQTPTEADFTEKWRISHILELKFTFLF